jgi:hypothetical protein
MCGCITTPGGTVVCDEHAAQMMNAVTDLLGEPVELPQVLTPTELAGFASLVNSWLDEKLGPGQEAQA